MSTSTSSLLALHARAIHLRDSLLFEARTRLDAFREEHSASDHGWGNTGGETVRAEEAALIAAFNSVEKACQDSKVDLCAAIRAAAWGTQPDGSFVSRSSVTLASMQMYHTLHAPAKRGPLCEVRDNDRGSGSSLQALRTREEARMMAIMQRCDNHDRERLYAGLRRRAAAILRAGGSLSFCTGQNGGFVTLADRCHVSARGALVAAGLTVDTAIAVLQTCQTSGRLSIHGLTGENYGDLT